MDNTLSLLMRGRLPAILVVSLACAAAFFVPFVALLSGTVIGLVALRKGLSEALIIAAISCIPAFFMLQTGYGRPDIALPLLFFLSIPIILAARLLAKTKYQGIAVLATAATAFLFVIVLRLTFQDIDQFWIEWLDRTVKYVKGATVSGFSREGSMPFVTGLVSSMLALCMILTTLFSRWLQSHLYNPGGFAEEFYSLRIPKIIAWIVLSALLVYAALTYGEGNILSDLLMISTVAYTFQGLATLHGATKTIELPRMWLLITYLSLFLLPRFTMVMLALIGITDSYFDFRNWKRNEKEEI